MKIISIITLSAILLSMSMGIVAAQASVQEPIEAELNQWQQAGRAFMSGLYPQTGARSLIYQLPPNVAKDIVELAKPKEKWGFIKNHTDKPIRILNISDGHWCPNGIIYYDKPLLSMHQIRFIAETGYTECRGYRLIGRYYSISKWTSGISDRLISLYVELETQVPVKISNVMCSGLTNINVYKEGRRLRLEVTSPRHPDPVIYYSERVEGY